MTSLDPVSPIALTSIAAAVADSTAVDRTSISHLDSSVSNASIAQFSKALSEIQDAAAANVSRSQEIQRRVKWYAREIDKGTSIEELITREEAPRIVELLTMNAAALDAVGSGFRASLALALRSEGVTIGAIADLFGVTRQRISALLRQKAALAIAPPAKTTGASRT